MSTAYQILTVERVRTGERFTVGLHFDRGDGSYSLRLAVDDGRASHWQISPRVLARVRAMVAADPTLRLVPTQCWAEWPSPVTGGLTDARCVNDADLVIDNRPYCASCASAMDEA